MEFLELLMLLAGEFSSQQLVVVRHPSLKHSGYWRGELWNLMVEQESQMKESWGDATGYLKEFLMDMSLKHRLLHTPALLATHTGNSPYHYLIFIFDGRTQMHMAGLPWFSKHLKFENDSVCFR